MAGGEPPPASSTGAPAAPLRTLAVRLLEALHTRLELVGVEFEIHMLVLLRVLLCLLGALACGLLALVFALAALILVLWDRHRLLGLLGATGLFAALAVLLAAFGARALRRQPPALTDSVRELAQDERQLGGA